MPGKIVGELSQMKTVRATALPTTYSTALKPTTARPITTTAPAT